jgi:colanic acid/amylovoran biosynthesis glycosyltransferase
MPRDDVLKVTFCVYDKPDSVGGPVSWIQRLIPALRDRSIEPRCLFLLHWGDTGPALEKLRGEGIECDAILAPIRTYERVQWILERLAEDPPDVFVPNLVVAGYFAGCAVRAAGIPTVGVLHSDDDYYRAIQDEFVFGDPAFRVSSLVCVSAELERQVNERQPHGVVVTRIPYGVTIPMAAVKRPDGTMRIAFVGRLAQEQKRVLDVARAFCRVVAEVPGTEAVIYGDGPERDEVLEIIARTGRDSAVEYGGVIPSEQIQSALIRCHVVVLLSDYEGLPIALLEAMACGCVPVCIRMRSGIPELVTDGETGILVTDRGDGFVDAIRRLRSDLTLWENLSENARAAARAFDVDSCADAWASLLTDLGSRKSAGRFSVPNRIRLPRLNLSLESEEQRRREPGIALRAYQRGRMLAGKLRRLM